MRHGSLARKGLALPSLLVYFFINSFKVTGISFDPHEKESLINMKGCGMDPKHSHMIKLVERHATMERACDIEGTLATLVPDPVYHLWNGRKLEGMDTVRKFYTQQLGGREGSPPGLPYRLGWKPEPPEGDVVRGLWVNDDAVVMDCLMPHQQADGTLKHFPVVAVFPFRDGLIVGENVTTVPEYAPIMDLMIADWDAL